MKSRIKQLCGFIPLVIGLLTLVTGVILAHGQAIHVEPEIVKPGESVSIQGEGFEAGSTVRITLHGHDDALKIARADDTGMFSVEATIPADMPDGVHMLMARDETGEMAQFRLTVDSTAAPSFRGSLTYIIGGASVVLLLAGVALLRMKGSGTHA